MNDTTDNFWSAWLIPAEEPKNTYCRLYHDDHGVPLFYSVEDLPGNYIDIDGATYFESSMNVRVINGKIVRIEPKVVTYKLMPGDAGTPCHPTDVSVVVDIAQPHTKWRLQTNDKD
jgi:hypothetical protein